MGLRERRKRITRASERGEGGWQRWWKRGKGDETERMKFPISEIVPRKGRTKGMGWNKEKTRHRIWIKIERRAGKDRVEDRGQRYGGRKGTSQEIGKKDLPRLRGGWENEGGELWGVMKRVTCEVKRLSKKGERLKSEGNFVKFREKGCGVGV